MITSTAGIAAQATTLCQQAVGNPVHDVGIVPVETEKHDG